MVKLFHLIQEHEGMIATVVQAAVAVAVAVAVAAAVVTILEVVSRDGSSAT
jgi:hypothetical protein